MWEYITQPWPWYVAGPLIALIMALLLLSGRRFGVSSNFTTICTIAGAGKASDYFNIDWKANKWNLVFILGTIIGGFIAHYAMMPDPSVKLAAGTVEALKEMNFESPGADFEPARIFTMKAFSDWRAMLILIVGGFLVGFGARYADGCTSGHAISGLCNLQFPSLITVVGFFIGGLTMVWIILPALFNN